MAKKRLAEVLLSCGRQYLSVAGIAVAIEGDVCRHQFPEEVYEPIPADEMESATVGGQSIKELPMDVVRFFRREYWTPQMLERAAEQINKEAKQ